MWDLKRQERNESDAYTQACGWSRCGRTRSLWGRKGGRGGGRRGGNLDRICRREATSPESGRSRIPGRKRRQLGRRKIWERGFFSEGVKKPLMEMQEKNSELI